MPSTTSGNHCHKLICAELVTRLHMCSEFKFVTQLKVTLLCVCVRMEEGTVYSEQLSVFLHLERSGLVLELLLQSVAVCVGSLSERGQAGLQSLNILHQLQHLTLLRTELRLQTGARHQLRTLVLLNTHTHTR